MVTKKVALQIVLVSVFVNGQMYCVWPTLPNIPGKAKIQALGDKKITVGVYDVMKFVVVAQALSIGSQVVKSVVAKYQKSQKASASAVAENVSAPTESQEAKVVAPSVAPSAFVQRTINVGDFKVGVQYPAHASGVSSWFDSELVLEGFTVGNVLATAAVAQALPYVPGLNKRPLLK